MLEDFTEQPLLGVRVHLATIRHLARVRLSEAPQRLPHRLLGRVAHASYTSATIGSMTGGGGMRASSSATTISEPM